MVRERDVDGLVGHQWADREIGKFRRLKTPEPLPAVSVNGFQDAYRLATLRWSDAPRVFVSSSADRAESATTTHITGIHYPSRTGDGLWSTNLRLIRPERVDLVRRLEIDCISRPLLWLLGEDA